MISKISTGSEGRESAARGLLALQDGRQHGVPEQNNQSYDAATWNEQTFSDLKKESIKYWNENKELRGNLQEKTKEADTLRLELKKIQQKVQRDKTLIKNLQDLDASRTQLMAFLTQSIMSAHLTAEHKWTIVQKALSFFNDRQADEVLHAVLAQRTHWARIHNMVDKNYNPLVVYLILTDEIKNRSQPVALSLRDIQLYLSRIISVGPEVDSLFETNFDDIQKCDDLKFLWENIKAIKALSEDKESTFDLIAALMEKFRDESKFVKYLRSMVYHGMQRLCQLSHFGLLLEFGTYFEKTASVERVSMGIVKKLSSTYLLRNREACSDIREMLDNNPSEDVKILWDATNALYAKKDHMIMYILKLSRFEMFEDMETLTDLIWQQIVQNLTNNVSFKEQQVFEYAPMEQEFKGSPPSPQVATSQDTCEEEICLHHLESGTSRPPKRQRAVPDVDNQAVLQNTDSHVPIVLDENKVQCHFQERFFSSNEQCFSFGDLGHLKSPETMDSFRRWLVSHQSKSTISKEKFEELYIQTNWTTLSRDLSSDSASLDGAFESILDAEFINPDLLGNSKHLSPWQVFHRVQANGGFERLSNEKTWDNHFPRSGKKVLEAYVDLIEGVEFAYFQKFLEEYDHSILRTQANRRRK